LSTWFPFATAKMGCVPIGKAGSTGVKVGKNHTNENVQKGKKTEGGRQRNTSQPHIGWEKVGKGNKWTIETIKTNTNPVLPRTATKKVHPKGKDCPLGSSFPKQKHHARVVRHTHRDSKEHSHQQKDSQVPVGGNQKSHNCQANIGDFGPPGNVVPGGGAKGGGGSSRLFLARRRDQGEKECPFTEERCKNLR